VADNRPDGGLMVFQGWLNGGLVLAREWFNDGPMMV
jgi:hypothetical protein